MTARAATVGSALGRLVTARVLLIAAPFLFYVVPFVSGYGWNALSPMTPTFAGLAPDPARASTIPTAVEHYGTGVVVVPFQARLRAYLRDGELPLWNPYSGLGQPFAAQGEGSPYFPLAIVRSLLPTSWANAVTFGMIAVSAVSLYLFLRLLGLAAGAAAFGGAAWSLSGVFTLNVARNNYVDQAAMIPPLFLAAAWAIASGRVLAYVVFAVVVALHAVAGLLQMGVNALLLLCAFVVFFACLRGRTKRGRLQTAIVAFVFLGLGAALAAPYVLPIVEGVRAGYNKNVQYLAFYTIPSANGVAFFFPLVFGQVFQSWIAGRYPEIVDWNNLYAHGSTGLLLLAVLALAALPRDRRDQRLTYFFFLGGLVFFHGRFMSFPPVSFVSFLPILSQQSPKHNNWVAVFCLVVVAAFGVEWLRQVQWRRARWLIVVTALALVSSILTVIGRRGGFAQVDGGMAVLYLGATFGLGALLVAAFWLASRAPSDAEAATIATAAVVGECSVYLLLGNDDPAILALRIGIGVLVGVVGVLAARGLMMPAAVAGLVALGAHAWVVMVPPAGLPGRTEIDTPPRYMTWLHAAAGAEYRAFGIYPDYSSVGEIQDVEAVGPIATNELVAFVGLVANRTVIDLHRNGSTFALRQLYDLTADYPRARPLFDWIGVRYLVLDTSIFNPSGRRDHESLLDPASGMRVAYEDETVTIVESPTAQSKAFFTSRVQESSEAAILARLKSNPRAIEDSVAVETDLGEIARAGGSGTSVPVPLAEYRPNDLRATFDAPAPGVFVVKDSYFPGWSATVNGRPAELIRVNGLVRGVVVPAAGPTEVTMSYRPPSFENGVAIGAATLVFLVALLAWDVTRRRRRGARAGGRL